MKKRFVSVLVAMFLVAVIPSVSFAATTEGGVVRYLSGNEGTYTYWIQDKSTYVNKTYGGWTNKGSVFVGPGTLTKSYESHSSISITGNGEVSDKSIKAGLSSAFTKDRTYTTKVSRYVPKGKKGQFQIRNVYKNYKVKMIQWISIDGKKKKTGKTKTVNMKKKSGIESRIALKNA